jgi:hypothetical protein
VYALTTYLSEKVERELHEVKTFCTDMETVLSAPVEEGVLSSAVVPLLVSPKPESVQATTMGL